MQSDFKKNIFPEAPKLKSLLGPSFVILGLGLGSGELILWPYLAATYGMGIIWGALVGITLQFFMNMEIERYALLRGESIFVGFYRKNKYLPIWFIFSTFVPWIWPGIIAASAKIFGTLLGIQQTNLLAVGGLIAIGVILSFGKIIYKTVERLQKILITISVPIIFSLAIYLANSDSFQKTVLGLVGIGDNYILLPSGISIATFLGALAYAGAGGNLNLAQSTYIKEKGYGMGRYASKLTNLFSKNETVALSGSTFDENPANIQRFQAWWKLINIEHAIIFLITGATTMILLALLANNTLYGQSNIAANISFVIQEANIISAKTVPFIGVLFLIITGCMLFATQLTVFDATSRILSENVILASQNKIAENKLATVYYAALWLQISAGIIIYLNGFTEPLQLVITSAVMNAIAMFVHSGLTLWLNHTTFSNTLRTSKTRTLIMLSAFIFYGGFSLYTIITKLLGN